MEIWKKIDGFEYEVSSYGRVKALSRKVWNGRIWHNKEERILKNRGGEHYQYITLCDNGKYKKQYIHRLVAESFIPNVDDKPEVNHIDGDKTNNNISNLEWNTISENRKHAFKTGLIKPYDRKGNKNSNYKHGKRCII